MKKLALFDFDGTITTRDTFIEFIKFHNGIFSFMAGFTLLSPVLLLFKAGLIPNWKAKEMVMKYFWAGTGSSDFTQSGKEFAATKLPALCRKGAIEKIKTYREQDWQVYVVSASASPWIEQWTREQGVGLISTRLEVKEGKITGKIDGKNCYGPEKVNRIKLELNLTEYTEIHAYGDSSGDREMLQLAGEPFYKPFRS